MVPVLAMALSLIDLIRRNELSLSTGHPMLLVVYAALGGALTLCVLLATASKETIAAFLFVACTAMQCVRLLLYCSLSAADLALLLPLRGRLATSIPVVICYYLVQGGFQGCYPFPDQVLWPYTCTLCTQTHASAPSVRALTWTPRMHIACTGALRQEPGHLPGDASVDLPGVVPAHREARGADCQPPLHGWRVCAGVWVGAPRLTSTSRRAAAWPKCPGRAASTRSRRLVSGPERREPSPLGS